MWKNVKVDRWEGQIEIQVPKSAVVLESDARGEEQGYDPVARIKNALKNPLGMEEIKGLVNKGSKVAIAFDDPLKFCPSYLTIPVILEELRNAGVREDNIVLVSAGGMHKKHRPIDFYDYRYRGYGLPPGGGTKAVPKEILEEFWPHRFIQHDCANPEGLVNMGLSKLGDIAEFDKVLQDYDLVIYTGSINSMGWGGYTGTGVVVGLGSARSIMAHHGYRVINHKESCHGDPERQYYQKHKTAVMERIEEYIGRKVFYIDGFLNGARQWTFSAGHYKEIREPLWKVADKDRIYEAEQADVLVVGMAKWVNYDTSRNPWTCLHAPNNILRQSLGKPILREGGVLILVAFCDGHIDTDMCPTYPEVLDLFIKVGNAQRLEDQYLEEYLFYKENYLKKYMAGQGHHPAHAFPGLLASQYLLDHVGKFIIATPENPGALRSFGVSWAEDFNQAWQMAEKVAGKNPKTVVLPSFLSKVPFKFAVK